MEFVSIRDWNEKVEKAFEEVKEHLPEYQKEVEILEQVLGTHLSTKEKLTLESRYQELMNLITDLSQDTSLGFYSLEVQPFLQKFSQLSTEKSVSFVKKDRRDKNLAQELTRSYLELVKKYNTILKLELPDLGALPQPRTCVCSCGNKKDFEIVDERVYYCLKCGVEVKENVGSQSTFKDIDRVNASGKYRYTREINMQKCIKQYQGKQKVTIPPQCLADVREELRINNIVKHITPQHARNALQQTKWSSQYENYILIWSLLDLKHKCPDISEHESGVMSDFVEFEREYNLLMMESDEERTSFIHYPFCLYQLLRKRSVRCVLDFFNMLKSDRIEWLNEKTEKIFMRLKWEGFEPLGH